jgi:predicted HTH domain antitoxin
MGERTRRKRTMEIELIIDLYKQGTSTTKISKLANISTRRINQILNESTIERRPHGHWKRQYDLNEDYFKVWSNNMAYIQEFRKKFNAINEQFYND